MPLILAWIAEFGAYLLTFIGPLIVKALLTLGISFVTYHYATGPFVALISGALGGAPAMAIQSLAAINFDKAVTIVVSAYVAKASSRFVMSRGTAPRA